MKSHNYDKTLLITVILLSIFGLIMISSASVVVSYNNFGYNHYYLSHQFLYGFLPGMVLLFLFKKYDYHIFKKYAAFLLIAAVILLLLVFVPDLGFGLKGASRWVSFGEISFQPSEVAKLSFILYLAAWLEGRNKNLKTISNTLIPFAIIVAIISIPLTLQPDVGTLCMIAIIAVIMYFISGAKMSHIFAIASCGILGLVALIKIAPYRMDRLMVFMYPELDPQGIGYQVNQALLALGSGGLFGVGFGYSRQKFNYLPEPIGDSIFAVIGEELGMIGLIFVIVLFLVFAVRGFKIASKAKDDFGKLIATGITSWITFQALMNIAAITSLIPLTGIPLPFVSYGGSALVMSLAGVGILLNVGERD